MKGTNYTKERINTTQQHSKCKLYGDGDETVNHMICEYIKWWQKLLGSPRSGSTTLSYRNCVITPGWRLTKAGYRMCFDTLYDEKDIFKNSSDGD